MDPTTGLGEWAFRSPQDASGFLDAAPFPHVVIDGCLEPAFCRELTAAFPPFERGNARNETGELAGKSVYPAIATLGGPYARFDRLMRSGPFLKLLETITGIPNLLYDPDYVGGGTHENRPGQELDLHVDFNYHPRTQWHRRLNLILYLNEEWDAGWGGALELARDPWRDGGSGRVIVNPEWNRAVIFETSERSWHGFERITAPDGRSRKSIAVYFYTKTRPDAAPSHATVYVPRPLPRHLTSGHELTESDVSALETLLARRDQQIRFLHEREQMYASWLASPTFRLTRGLTWPLRSLRDWLRKRRVVRP